VIRLFGFSANAVDVDFDALIIKMAGVDGKPLRFFFINAALCIGVGVARQASLLPTVIVS
jgi:hypothetical protein